MNDQSVMHGEAEISWQVPEYEKHERSKAWYVTAAIVLLFLVVYSLFGIKFWQFDFSQLNPLFLFIILLSSFIIIMNDKNEPDMVRVSLTDEGVVVGRRFYDYDEIKDFSIIYKPKIGVKNLYFEFKAATKHRLSIPLDDRDPLLVRELLLKYLPEDLDRTDPPASESLAKILKL